MVNKSDLEKLELFQDANEEEIFHSGESEFYSLDHSKRLSILKTGWMLLDWIDEEKEEAICDKFNVGPGDIRRIIDTAQWLLYSAVSISKLFKFDEVIEPLEILRQRIKYGIKEELTDLVFLKGIGRVRARNLFKKGFKKLRDIKKTPAKDLSRIPRIAESLAENIKQQILKLEV